MMLKQSPFQPFGHVASGGGGNATVPNDAPIQPPQAFVDNIGKFITPSNPITISNASSLILSNSIFDGWRNSVDTPTLVFGNSLNTTSLDDILLTVSLLVNAPDHGSLDISNNSSQATDQPGVCTIQIPSGTSGVWRLRQGANDTDIDLNAGNVFADSGVALDQAGDQTILIGVSDSPTATQIATKIAQLCAFPIGDPTLTATSSGNQVTFRQTFVGFWPLQILQNAPNFTLITFNDGSSGPIKVLTADNGWTVKSKLAGVTVTFTL